MVDMFTVVERAEAHFLYTNVSRWLIEGAFSLYRSYPDTSAHHNVNQTWGNEVYCWTFPWTAAPWCSFQMRMRAPSCLGWSLQGITSLISCGQACQLAFCDGAAQLGVSGAWRVVVSTGGHPLLWASRPNSYLLIIWYYIYNIFNIYLDRAHILLSTEGARPFI